MKIEILDRHGESVGTIRKRDLFVFVHTDELNGEDSVSISTLFPLAQGYRLLWKDKEGNYHEHVCQNPRVTRELGTPIYSDVAINSICELFGDIVEECDASNRAVKDVFQEVMRNTRFNASITDTDAKFPSNTDFSHKSAREVLNACMNAAQKELITTIEVNERGVGERKLALIDKRGNQDGHRRFTYGKDLLKVERTEHAGVITACYGYGKELESKKEERIRTKAGDPVHYESSEKPPKRKKLTFASVNDGKSYVVDEGALKAYGLSSDKDSARRNIFGVYENSNISDPSELKRATLEYLHAHSKPQVSYSVDVVDLASYEREWEGVGVGDAVDIVDTCFNPVLRVHGRVTKIVRNYIDKTANVTLGNIALTLTDIYTYQQKQLQQLDTKVDNLDTFSPSNDDHLKRLIDNLNRKFNANGASYYHIDFATGSTWSSVPMDASGTPLKEGGWAINISSLGFRIAKNRNADGSWNWRTFGTGEGLTADTITSGTLNADLIRAGVIEDRQGENSWNLTTGELKTKGMHATNAEVEGLIRSYIPNSSSHINIQDGVIRGFKGNDEENDSNGFINFNAGIANSGSSDGVLHGLQIVTNETLLLATPSIYMPINGNHHSTYSKMYTGNVNFSLGGSTCTLGVYNGLIYSVSTMAQ